MISSNQAVISLNDLDPLVLRPYLSIDLPFKNTAGFYNENFIVYNFEILLNIVVFFLLLGIIVSKLWLNIICFKFPYLYYLIININFIKVNTFLKYISKIICLLAIVINHVDNIAKCNSQKSLIILHNKILRKRCSIYCYPDKKNTLYIVLANGLLNRFLNYAKLNKLQESKPHSIFERKAKLGYLWVKRIFFR